MEIKAAQQLFFLDNEKTSDLATPTQTEERARMLSIHAASRDPHSCRDFSAEGFKRFVYLCRVMTGEGGSVTPETRAPYRYSITVI